MCYIFPDISLNTFRVEWTFWLVREDERTRKKEVIRRRKIYDLRGRRLTELKII